MSLIEEVGMLSDPNSTVIEWTISNVSSYLKKHVWLRSPDFHISNYFWYLIMVPNDASYKEFVGLYFCENEKRVPLSPYKTYVDFTFGIKTVDDEIVNEYSNAWEQNKDGWVGLEKFIKKSDLFKKKKELIPSDTLTITCWAQIHGPDSFPDLVTRFHTLSASFKDMFISQKNADLLIDVKGQRFTAHKFILTARCPALSDFIEKEMSKENTKTVNIPDCDPEVFHMFLSYLYSGELNFSKCNVFSLYKIAAKYNILELKSVCVDFIIRRLCVKNVCEIYVLGHNFSDEKILTCTQKFFEKNFNEILSSDSWVALMGENCELANNLLKTMAPKIVIKNGFWSP